MIIGVLEQRFNDTATATTATPGGITTYGNTAGQVAAQTAQTILNRQPEHPPDDYYEAGPEDGDGAGEATTSCWSPTVIKAAAAFLLALAATGAGAQTVEAMVSPTTLIVRDSGGPRIVSLPRQARALLRAGSVRRIGRRG
ncbi:hypothetical protein ACU4GD_14420 [Cupriavidus basilensis]